MLPACAAVRRQGSFGCHCTPQTPTRQVRKLPRKLCIPRTVDSQLTGLLVLVVGRPLVVFLTTFQPLTSLSALEAAKRRHILALAPTRPQQETCFCGVHWQLDWLCRTASRRALLWEP